MSRALTYLKLLPLSLFLVSCNVVDLSKLTDSPLSKMSVPGFSFINKNTVSSEDPQKASLADMLSEESDKEYVDSDFAEILRSAILSDPAILSLKADLLGRKSLIDVSKAQKDFQVSGSLYGGLEDVSNGTSGLAVVLNANRLLFDGGAVDAKISSETLLFRSSEFALKAKVEDRASELINFWVDLERYEALSSKIQGRLNVLDPLIGQLEKVAEAGLGDVSQVAAAQRTIATIKVTKTTILESRDRARINFSNAFGGLPLETEVDSRLIGELASVDLSTAIIEKAPRIQEGYMAYLAAESNLAAMKKKYNYKVGFETSVTHPFGGSDRDSDQRLGLVVRKTLYNGRSLDAEVLQAKSVVKSKVSSLQAVHQQGLREVQNAKGVVDSLDNAKKIAVDNAKVAASEINYLKKQLVIGGSTLDQVLSAEARLYEAEAQEINFIADRIKAQVIIVSALGLLSAEIGLLEP
jgi:outer membrane protein TolC